MDIKFNDEDCHGLYQRGFILSRNIINKGDMELKKSMGLDGMSDIYPGHAYCRSPIFWKVFNLKNIAKNIGNQMMVYFFVKTVCNSENLMRKSDAWFWPEVALKQFHLIFF